MKSLEVIITPKGETKIETRGFQGPSCREASRALIQALGIQTEERVTGEFWATEHQTERLKEDA